jgi:membrane protease YdiL (CAAX protease family)
LPSVPFQHAIGGLGPLLASVLTTCIFYKKEGLKKLFANFFRIKPLFYFAIALLSPFILALIAACAAYFINNSPVSFDGIFQSKEFPQFSLLTFFAYNLIFFGFGEEAGWRGFALPRFQKFSNGLVASILLTVFWALWHLPLFFYRPGYTSMEIAGITGWFFSLLTGSILLSWLYNSSGGSILICAVFHSTIDIAFTADFSDTSVVNYMGFLITVWGILTILVFKPKNLSVNERVRSE